MAWWADFARNRMVVAYTDRSKNAANMSDSTWYRVLARKDVEVGRADPTLAPVFGQVASPRLEQPYTRQTNLGWSHQVDSATAVLDLECPRDDRD